MKITRLDIDFINKFSKGKIIKFEGIYYNFKNDIPNIRLDRGCLKFICKEIKTKYEILYGMNCSISIISLMESGFELISKDEYDNI